MSEAECLIVRNNCQEEITVNMLRPPGPHPRRQPEEREIPFTVKPGESYRPLQRSLLEGATGWDELRKRDCVIIERVTLEAHYGQVVNLSSAALELAVRLPAKAKPKTEAVVKLKPGKKSRTVDLRSIVEPDQLSEAVDKGEATLLARADIFGAAIRRGAVASYGNEDVYICYECGGPIVFRGDPPRPIHI